MITDFKYCPNPDAEVPKMFIDTQIGNSTDENGNVTIGIDGSAFMKELYCLSDEMGKKNIEVWINSEGGSIKEGMNIYSAILECNANVDTVCYGIAASMGAVIFQAGRKKIMYDYTWLMYHNAHSSEKPDDGLTSMNNSICKMVASRTGKSESEVLGIMRRETYIMADEAKLFGFCDEVRASNEQNKKRALVASTPRAMWEVANKIVNKINDQKPITMNYKNITAKLGLIEEASETSILNAIDQMQNKSKSEIEEAKASLAKAQDEVMNLKKKVADMEDAAKKEAEAKAKAEEEAKAEAKKAIEAKAELKIKEAVTAGKIKNEEKVIASYKAMYVENPERTEEIIDGLVGTKKGASLTSINNNVDIKDSPAESSARAAGLKAGSAQWYNHIKVYELQNKK